MKQRTGRLKIIIVLLSLLVHILLAIILFISPLSPLSIGDFSLSSAPQLEQQQPATDIDTNTPEWAELKARQSSFGASVEFVDEFTTPETPQEEPTDDTPEDKTEESETPETDSQPTVLSDGPRGQETQKTAETTQPVRKKKKKKKGKGSFTLAQLTQGYLKNSQTNGAYNIGMTGNPNALPTQEQLIFERFAAKLAWEVQNAHVIHMNQYQLPPLQSTMKLYFVLERNGKMHSLRIMQSSGNRMVDQYILFLFEYASSSFPPVPSLLKQDPVPLLYTCMINFQQPGPLRFQRH